MKSIYSNRFHRLCPNKEETIIKIQAEACVESTKFLENLFHMYSSFAENKNWKLSILHVNKTDSGNIEEIEFSVSGKYSYLYFYHESGIHRVQTIPFNQSIGKILTTTVSVEVFKKGEEKHTSSQLERIRTYNFPQNRVTDHRTNFTLYKLDEILQGNAEDLLG